jgi:hypothetical protein
MGRIFLGIFEFEVILVFLFLRFLLKGLHSKSILFILPIPELKIEWIFTGLFS